MKGACDKRLVACRFSALFIVRCQRYLRFKNAVKAKGGQAMSVAHSAVTSFFVTGFMV